MQKFRYFLLFLIILVSVTPLLSFAYQSLTLFTSEQAAQQHCPDDEIVWLNKPTGIWHVRGARWYANTNNGAFVCKQEAAVTGNRASRNG